MSKLLHSRLFRLLVCLILVASFLVNLSPLKAEATAVVGTLLTFEGLMAALFSMSIGVVAVDLTVETWNKIGQGLGEEIANADSSVAEAWVDVEALYNSYGPDDDDPEDALEWAEKLKHALSRGLLAAIAGWLCSLVNMGGYDVGGDAATTGWTYYGEFLLPTFPTYDDHPYQVLIKSTSGRYYMNYTNKPLYATSNGLIYCSTSYTHYDCNVSESLLDSWSSSDSIFKSTTRHSRNSSIAVISESDIFLWTNVNIYSASGSTLYYSGSEPTTTKTEIIEPSIYVGDIPQQIQDGDKNEENLELPIIDPFRVIQSPSTALDDVNQLQQQLQSGTTTLDQYLEQVTYQDTTTDPDPTTDPSSPTSPSTGTDTEWEPPEDPGEFALDLTNVFPFCIPFDLYDFLTCLNADPVAPVIQWDIAMPGGGSYPLTLDLSPFDSVAQLLRRLELLLFCVGLAIKTRDLIKG